MPITRREFLRLGLTGAGSVLFSSPGAALSGAAARDPHFFLVVVLDGAADSSYMFDARPLSMTAAGKIQNYWSKNGEEPVLWQGLNGESCWATPLIKPLIPFRSRFSILNGVMMTPTFDGHLQNMNFLFAGGPFGGDSFIPHLNSAETGRAPDSLDGLSVGNELSATLSNHSAVVPLTPESVGEFAQRLKSVPAPAPGTELMDFIRGRIQYLSTGTGRFSKGAALMSSGLDGAPELQARLIQLQKPASVMGLVIDSFKKGVARSAVYTLPQSFDVHAPDAARSQPKLFTDAIGEIASVFKALSETSYDRTRSMFDMTTVLVATEMGRTLRIEGQPIHDTGTNHNQFSNSFLLAGKGVRGNLVVGASDLSDEKAPVSKMHRTLDPILEKTIGRPFDFANLRSRPDLPESLKLEDHLTVGSLINTIYSAFGVPARHFRTLGRDLPAAPVLRGLLG